MRQVRLLLAAALLAIAAGRAAAQTPLGLQDAIDRALAANPAIAAARLQRPVDVAGVGVAGERPNPEVTYEGEKETPRQAIGLTVPIELGGKRGARLALANATVSATDAEIARTIAEVRNAVRRTYFEAAAAERRVTMASDLVALATRGRDAARSRFQSGDVAEIEVVQTELALADAENELTGAQGDAAAAHAQLNALIGQRPAAPITTSDELTAGVVPALPDALAQATQSNAELAAIDRRIAAQRARIDLAHALQIPDLGAGTSLTYDAYPEFRYGWRLTFSFTVPLLTRHRAGVLVEDAELTRLRAERGAAAARMTGDVSAALARASAAQDELARYQSTILPRVVDLERMAQAAYAAGQTGVTNLLQALQQARDVRQRGLQAGLDFQLALADLEQAIGAPIR